jgi:hypothetical protein
MFNVVLGGAAGGALVAFFGWLLRESIKASLQRDVTAHAEYLKHDLQREMLKAQLSTTQVHSVYPRLMEKLRRAEGAVGGPMGLQFKPTYDDHDLDDFTAILTRLTLPGGERQRILGLLEHSRREGIQELQKVERRVELWRGRASVGKARNFAVLKSLYLSEQVKKVTWDALAKLNHVWIDCDPNAGPDYVGARASLEEAEKLLAELEAIMRDELRPQARVSGA